jgi:hypothetical protein
VKLVRKPSGSIGPRRTILELRNLRSLNDFRPALSVRSRAKVSKCVLYGELFLSSASTTDVVLKATAFRGVRCFLSAQSIVAPCDRQTASRIGKAEDDAYLGV